MGVSCGTAMRVAARKWSTMRMRCVPAWLEELLWLALAAVAIVALVAACIRFPLFNLVVVVAAGAAVAAVLMD
jgi:hypothetical protein